MSVLRRLADADGAAGIALPSPRPVLPPIGPAADGAPGAEGVAGGADAGSFTAAPVGDDARATGPIEPRGPSREAPEHLDAPAVERSPGRVIPRPADREPTADVERVERVERVDVVGITEVTEVVEVVGAADEPEQVRPRVARAEAVAPAPPTIVDPTPYGADDRGDAATVAPAVRVAPRAPQAAAAPGEAPTGSAVDGDAPVPQLRPRDDRPAHTPERAVPSPHPSADDAATFAPERSVEVRIGTIEVFAAEPAPTVGRTAHGFDDYVAVRAYDWGDDG